MSKWYETTTCPWSSSSLLYGPSMFAVKAKIYGVFYNQSSSIASDERSSYWSAPKKKQKKKKNSLLSIGHYMTTMVSIGQHFVTTRVVHLPKKDRTILLTEADLTIESNIAVRAVHSCNSWFNPCFSLPSNFELRLWLNFLHFVFR